MYYYKHATGEAQWEKPAEFDDSQRATLQIGSFDGGLDRVCGAPTRHRKQQVLVVRIGLCSRFQFGSVSSTLPE